MYIYIYIYNGICNQRLYSQVDVDDFPPTKSNEKVEMEMPNV